MQELIFNGVIGKESTFFIANTYFNNLEFIRCINSGYLNFSSCETGNKKVEVSENNLDVLKRFSRFNEIKASRVFLSYAVINNFEYVQTKPLLKIVNSNLGKLEFAGCKFQDADFIYSDSKISELFLSADTVLPEDIKGSETQKRYLFTQLKKVYDQQGDQVRSNAQFANEMNSYIETLGWESHFWEKLRLSLNQFSNNHGQSWEQALGVTLGIGYLLFAIYGSTLLFSKETNEPVFKQCPFLYFLEFINPLHKTNFMVDNEMLLNGFVLTVDGISRIILAYFVYQFIQAFRKQGKS